VNADGFFALLAAIVETRRAAFRERCTIAFAVVDGGGFVLDSHAPAVIEKTYRAGCDVSILCNTSTLRDILTGTFDFEAPRAGQLFRWGGKIEALQALARVLCGGGSALALRVSG
jgi:hypothetical protein